MLVSLHDLGLAARWCDRLILLDRGRLVADGPPEAVLTPARLAAVYGITAYIGRDASRADPAADRAGVIRRLRDPIRSEERD